MRRASYLFLCAAAVCIAFPKFTTYWYGVLPIQASDLMVGLAALAWAGDVATTRRLRWSPVFLPLILYLAAAFLSLTQADDLKHSLVKIVGIGSLMAALVVGWHVIDTRARWERLADVWIAAALGAALITLAGAVAYFAGVTDPTVNRMIGNFGSLPPGRIPRLEGPFLNSNMFCNYLGVSGCLLLAQRTRYEARFGRLGFFAAVAVVAVTLPFSMSPNLGAVAVSVIVLLLAAKAFPAWFRAASVTACAAAVVAFFMVTVFMVVPKGQGTSLGPLGDIKFIPSGRVAGWRAALDVVKEHPITGTGVGEKVAHFTHAFAAQGTRRKQTEFHLEAHNSYVGLLGQMGPLALVGYGLLLWRMIAALARAGHDEERLRWLRAGLMAAVLGQTVYGGLYGGFEDGRHTWLMFALLATAPVLLWRGEAEPA